LPFKKLFKAIFVVSVAKNHAGFSVFNRVLVFLPKTCLFCVFSFCVSGE